jgi:hypothetical protein
MAAVPAGRSALAYQACCAHNEYVGGPQLSVTAGSGSVYVHGYYFQPGDTVTFQLFSGSPTDKQPQRIAPPQSVPVGIDNGSDSSGIADVWFTGITSYGPAFVRADYQLPGASYVFTTFQISGSSNGGGGGGSGGGVHCTYCRNKNPARQPIEERVGAEHLPSPSRNLCTDVGTSRPDLDHHVKDRSPPRVILKERGDERAGSGFEEAAAVPVAELIEGAWTRTKTPSSGTTGVSIPATFNRSAGPGVSLRTAFIPSQFKVNGGYWSVMSVKA